MKTCTGALLCGGLSSRMGRDKALLEVEGQPLWKRQLHKLRTVCGNVMVCGNQAQRALFENENVPFASDAISGLGPLSGIARALEFAKTSHVLVLAVDMPKMPVPYLHRLWNSAGNLSGVVPENTGRYEGLCAVYPVGLLPWMEGQLSATDRSLQSLIRLGIEKHLLQPHPITGPELEFFENWNSPNDVAPLGVHGTDSA